MRAKPMDREERDVSLAVFAVSASVLCYEVLLTRLFAVIQWQSLSSVVIALAMLGFGAGGTFLAFFRGRVERDPAAWFLAFLLLYPASLVMGLAGSSFIPLNPFRLGADPREWLHLLFSLASAGVPFFFAACVVGLSLSRHPAGRTYFFNLTGSALGAFASVGLSFLLPPAPLLAFLAAASFLPAVLFARRLSPRAVALILSLSLPLSAAVLFCVLALGWPSPSPYKGLPRALLLPGARILAERPSPLGVVSAVEAGGLRLVGDLSLANPYPVPVQKALFFDGDAGSAVIPFAGDFDPVRYLDWTPAALPHHLLPGERKRSALIVGAGGGEGILRALAWGFTAVDAVEVNGGVIGLMEGELADFSGGLYRHPQVRVFHREARGYLSRCREEYDLIELALTDSFAAAASGASSLNETFLYTVESFKEMYRRLAVGGILAVTRWNTTPPRDGIRMLSLAAAALREMGVEDPGGRIFFLRSMRASVIAVCKTPLSLDAVSRGKDFAASRLFDLVWYPGVSPAEQNLRVRMDPPLYEEAVRRLLSEDRVSFIREYPFDLSPPTDERPYYHDFFRLQAMPFLLAAGPERIPLTEWGSFLLLLALVPAAAVSFLLILLPLALSPLRAKERLPVFLVFSLLGIAYFFVELPLIQKFVLFLHHPAASLAVVLASLLFFSGLGSWFSHRIFPQRGRILLACLAVAALLLTALAFLGPILRAAASWSGPARVAAAVLFLFPPGFLMGIPFPAALTRVKERDPALVPWAWGINGFFSVLAVLSAHLTAVRFGHGAVLALAGACYLAAGLISLRLRE